jgi:hypothetical protein
MWRKRWTFSRIGFYDVHALDAGDGGDIAPSPASKINLNVVQPERLDLDHHVAGQGFGFLRSAGPVLTSLLRFH